MSNPKSHTGKKQGTVVALQHSHPEQALEGLNRITGLNFARWPESLVPHTAAVATQDADAEFAPERVSCNGTPR
ncbi:hypothetical protein [Pseudomonas turukhanskensis]|uniref:Uncharacterized protein n=1 Tax=Pseudomonas turukhanskensis TaxID=1806536 RepID=A0A9W6KCA3_9PSED|nr:hypothetical protein [Pseudomonas turukhanskensis]GLK91399.1 hypothetical protein GCM10017655_44630 [Pseudomonas turukhanskensis]